MNINYLKKIFILLILHTVTSKVALSEEIPYLLSASGKGDLETVQAIIESGGDPNTVDKDNVSALMYAARKNQFAIADYLISKGANINDAEEDGWTALMYAAKKNHIEVIKILLANNRQYS